MKLKNNALQELYDTLVSAGVSMFSYADSPVYKAFKECDEKLSESVTFEEIKCLQRDNDILKRANEALLSANMEAISKNRKLEKENEGLLSRAKYAEDELERMRKAHDELFDAGSRKISEVRRENEAVNKKLEKEIEELHKHIDILSASEREAISAKNALEKDLADAKVQLHYFRHSRDDWQGRVKYAEDEVEALKKDNEDLKKRLMETTEVLEKVNSDRNELQKDRDSYHELYTELSKTYDKLSEDNKKLKVRTDCLRKEVEWYRKHYRDQSDKIQELKSRLNSIYGYDDEYIKKLQLQDGAHEIGYEQGQTDLWNALQNVNDAKPFELATCFPDVTCMDDILSWDLEDFMDAYKKWQEEKEKERLDHMRDYLARFCEGRVCKGCPLESNEFKCGCGYSFKKATNFDMKIIPDEELEKYYEKARGCCRNHFTKPDDPCSGLHKKVKEACDAFAEGLKAGLASEVKEVPVSCDIPIKDLGSWERTLEVNVEINKDLLEKVCGVKLEEKKPKPGELVITTHGVVTGNYTEAALKDIKEAIKNFEKSLPALDSWEATIKGSIKDT